MVNPNIINRKLAKMTNYIKELEELTSIPHGDFFAHFFYQRSAERLLQLMVEIAVDINNHILVDEGRPAGKDYYSSFFDLVTLGIYPEEFAREIAPSTGLRNILVHEYEEIDEQIVYKSMEKGIKQFKKYMSFILKYTNQ